MFVGYRNQIPRWRMIGLGMGGVPGPVFLFRDDFVTAEAAPLATPRTAEPGPGVATIIDTTNVVDIVDGQMVYSGFNADGDPGYWTDAQTRATGLVLYASLIMEDDINFGFDNNQTGVLGLTGFDNSGGAETLRAVIAAALPVIGTYDSLLEYELMQILRGTGDFLLIKGNEFAEWTLLYVVATGSTVTLFGSITEDDTRANDSKVSTIRVSQLPTPWDTDDGIGILVDDFTRANGPLGIADKGGAWVFDVGIWAIVGNVAVGTPVPGSELITNGDFTNWTGDDPDSWAVSGEAGADPEISEVGAGQGHGGAGNGFCNFFSSVAAEPRLRQSIMTIGNWYQITLDVNTFNSGNLQVFDNAGTFIYNFTSTGSKLMAGRTGDAVLQLRALGSGNDFTIDNVSVKQLTLTELFSSLESSTIEVLVDVNIVVGADTPAGVVTHLDSAATPANFLVAYHDGTRARLEKNVGGTYTSLINTAATHSAGATLRVIAFLDGSDLKVRLYYNNVLIGTEQTVSDVDIVSNTIHGLFSTNSGNTLDNFRVWPRNITGNALIALEAVADA